MNADVPEENLPERFMIQSSVFGMILYANGRDAGSGAAVIRAKPAKDAFASDHFLTDGAC